MMTPRATMTGHRILPIFMLVYGLASLAHFLHNATYLQLYPNMPPWLTPLRVLGSWLIIAAIGAAGYALFRKGKTAVGLALVGLYAALGFGGLDHYTLAPASAHTWVMNATIAAEAITAAVLLIVIGWMSRLRSKPVSAG